MMNSMQKEDEQRLEKYRDTLQNRQLLNSENFDKALLTYSSAALALSVTFLEKIVCKTNIISAWLLHSSWVCFCLTILMTLFSYLFGQKAIDVVIQRAEKYYKGEPHSESKSFSEKLNQCMPWISAILFAAAVMFFIYFSYSNLNEKKCPSEERCAMNENKTTSGIGQDSAHIPSMPPRAITLPTNPPPSPANPQPPQENK
jgi:hypothetical protein